MFTKRWPAHRERTRGIQFEGAPELLRLIVWLVKRPWRYGAERILPIVELRRPSPAGADPLDGLAEWLDAAGFTPWARTGARLTQRPPSVEDPNAPAPPPGIEDLLDVAVKDLAAHDGAGRRLRFPHYGLALWLIHLEPFSPAAVDREKEAIAGQLQVHLRERLVRNPFTDELADAVGDFPWWVRVASRALPRLGLVFMRVSWRPPRWFARHPISTSRSFFGLARTFADPDIPTPGRARVERLLVDAFLQDLRVAYRRKSVFGAGRRRTTYPVLLVEAGSGPAGALLGLIDADGDESRGRPRPRPRYEPLLVITNPVAGAGDTSEAYAPADARIAYDVWQDRQLRLARDRSATLPLLLPTETGRPGDWNNLVPLLPRRRRPWMSLVLPLVLLAGLIAVPQYNRDRCEVAWSPRIGRTLQREELGSTRSQCVGLSDGRYRFFAEAPPYALAEVATALGEVESDIAATNAAVLNSPAADGRKPVTVVYMSTLTTTAAGGYEALLEELRGLALAQENASRTQTPILVRLANAGDQMRYGGAAARLIVDAADRLNVVAVTGLGVSRTGTEEAIRELDRAGIPTLATLLTADDLENAGNTYHQIAPSNRRQAAVAAFYAKEKLQATEAVVYFSGDPADLYSSSLAEDVQTEFTARGIRVGEPVAYPPAASTTEEQVTSLGRGACPARTGYLVFFAGRPDEFRYFLDGLTAGCGTPDKGGYPTIMAGDAITEFALTGDFGDYPGLTLDYMSLASSRIWGTDCAAIQQSRDFFRSYQQKGYGDACTSGQASRAMFGWDAIETIRTAMINRSGSSGDDAARNQRDLLFGLNGLSGRNAVAGVTGTIEFSSESVRPQLPVDKSMLVMRTVGGAGSELRLLCGTTVATAADQECPADSSR